MASGDLGPGYKMPLQHTTQFDELLAWMQDNHCTFRQLAELSGLDKMTLQRLAHGDFKTFNKGWIGAIARATGDTVGAKQFVAFLGRLSAPKVKAPAKAAPRARTA